MSVTTESRVCLDALSSGGRRFIFVRPITVEVECPDGVWDIRHAETGFDCHGVTAEEAWENFGLLFANAWDSYVVSDAVSPFARVRKLKATLQGLIREVVPA